MDVAKRFGLESGKKGQIPMSPSIDLDPDVVMHRHNPEIKYQELVGALLYINRCTRPDVAFAVSKLSRYFQCYEPKHMNADKQVLWYLVSTCTHGLSYKKNFEIILTGFSDAAYAGNKQHFKSTSRIIFMINHSPLS